MNKPTGKHRLHQFLRLDTGARPFPPRVLIEDAAQDVSDYIQATAPVLAQKWCEVMARGNGWKEYDHLEHTPYMLNIYAAKMDAAEALHNAQMYLWAQCTIDDPE